MTLPRRARTAATTAARAAARAALIRLLERLPSQDLDAAVTAACVRRARRLSRPVRVPREEWERDGLLATIRRHAGETQQRVRCTPSSLSACRGDTEHAPGCRHATQQPRPVITGVRAVEDEHGVHLEAVKGRAVVQDGIAQGRADLQFTHRADPDLMTAVEGDRRGLRQVQDTARRRQPPAAQPTPPRCRAVIWPSSASAWGQCHGVILGGHCTAYGSQHDDANQTPTGQGSP